MKIGVPQIIMICMYGIVIGVGMVKHGKPKEGKESLWTTLIGTIISIGLLWWGGFWG